MYCSRGNTVPFVIISDNWFISLQEELKPALNLIKEKLKKFTEVQQGCKKTAEHIRVSKARGIIFSHTKIQTLFG